MTNPYRMFKAGNDTLQIAAALGVTEAEAYNALHAQREAERKTERNRAYHRHYMRRQREELRRMRASA